MLRSCFISNFNFRAKTYSDFLQSCHDPDTTLQPTLPQTEHHAIRLKVLHSEYVMPRIILHESGRRLSPYIEDKTQLRRPSGNIHLSISYALETPGEGIVSVSSIEPRYK